VPSTNAFPWRFVTPLYMGSALNPINSSLIATALVPIAAAVHVSVGRTAVLVSALYLASAIAQPTGGKLAEEFGPRRVFLAGILTVLAGGLVGGFGQDLTTLVVARVLIGVGTSAGYPSAMLLIRRRADAAGLGAPPGSVLGGLMIAGAATAAVGLPIGGVLVDACREGSRSHRSRPGPQLRGYLFDSRSATRRIRSMSVAEGITRPEI
jgi:MFS family permease